MKDEGRPIYSDEDGVMMLAQCLVIDTPFAEVLYSQIKRR